MMNRRIISSLVLALVITASATYAQDKQTEKPKKETKPVKNTFEATTLINNQTIEVLKKKTLQLVIQHRFGNMDEGISDLFGIFGPANIRIGLNYGITQRLMVGIGGTKSNHMYNLQWKYKLLRQTKSGSMPLTLTYYGDAEINTSEDTSKTFSNRIAYFHQLLIGRKFGKKLALQLAPSITHYNLIDTISYGDIQHDNININLSGRFNFSPQSSLIFEYNLPLTASEDLGTKPDLGIGVEISTGGHAFQLFLTTASGINNSTNTVYNTNDFTQGEMMLGFNISRKWRF